MNIGAILTHWWTLAPIIIAQRSIWYNTSMMTSFHTLRWLLMLLPMVFFNLSANEVWNLFDTMTNNHQQFYGRETSGIHEVSSLSKSERFTTPLRNWLTSLKYWRKTLLSLHIILRLLWPLYLPFVSIVHLSCMYLLIAQLIVKRYRSCNITLSLNFKWGIPTHHKPIIRDGRTIQTLRGRHYWK